uniref:Lipocalin n=1 Tax=Rhipicephalus appendiculatus TaxID=34631 RepID=A0A131YEC7_RHIAP
MLGTFDPRNKDRIFVQAKGSVYNITHEMLYLNWRHKCAVFKVTTPCYGMCSAYEVRVWNLSTALHNAGDCIRKFKKLEPYGRGVYDDDCQNIVHKSAQLPLLTLSRPKQERNKL